ncbi:MAG: tetratricopeptide repeat protein, partial [Plesiomonas shigelloides]
AEQGDVQAQYNVALWYAAGQGVAQDNAQAVYWYQQAALQNDADAQYSLALMYANGEGTSTDFVQAYAWLSVAGANGLQGALATREDVELEMTPSQLVDARRLTQQYLLRFEAKAS